MVPIGDDLVNPGADGRKRKQQEYERRRPKRSRANQRALEDALQAVAERCLNQKNQT